MPTFEEINAVISMQHHLLYTRWLAVELFSIPWLIMAAIIVVAYIILVKCIDKSRLREIILYGSLLAVTFGYIDVAGTMFGLWEYKTHFMPLNPSLFPLSYTLHPIGHMFVYQFTTTWTSFLIWNTVATAFFAFVAQPMFVWAEVLWIGKWNYFLSFLLGAVSTTFVRAVVIWLANIELKHTTCTSRAALSPQLQPAMKMLENSDQETEN